MQAASERPVALAVVRRFADLAVDALAQAREEIDALNVYPVPDGDTGTNMFLTVSSARDALAAAMQEGESRAAALAAYARGALLGARGNSGVILSEMLGAIARRLAAATGEESNAAAIADALGQASQAAYVAVGTPVEGTMLTVMRTAAEAAAECVKRAQARSADVISAAAEAARQALQRTPEQLPMLAAAGVVDAGGRGVTVLLDAADTALTGRRPSPAAQRHRPTIPVPHLEADLSPDGPCYEVMYLLDADDGAVPALRDDLAGLGDSLVVVGGDGLWNVHVHVDDVGAAIEAGIAVGRPHRIRVTHFAEQLDEQAAERAEEGAGRARGHASGHASGHAQPRRTGRAVIAVAAGPGLRELFEQSGAAVVDGGPGRRPSTGELLEAIQRCGAAEVLLLPNDTDSLRVASVAARTAEEDLGMRVAVIPTQAQVQGLAAVAVHEPGRTFDRDVLEMTATARHARHGAVTVAVKRAMTMAGPCEEGDVLGAIDGDFIRVGTDLGEVAVDVLGRLVRGGGELVTLVSGHDDEQGALAERCRAWLERHHPSVDVVVYDGGQQRYPLLVSVE